MCQAVFSAGEEPTLAKGGHAKAADLKSRPTKATAPATAKANARDGRGDAATGKATRRAGCFAGMMPSGYNARETRI